MEHENLTLVFDGAAVENGEIDVQDLAPALLSMGDLIQKSNDIVNGDRAKIAVRVRATAHGSFEVNLSLVQSFFDSAKIFLDFASANKEGIAAANDLADLIFKVGGGISSMGGGLIWLLVWLRGRKPDKIEEKDGTTSIHIGDTLFICDPRAVKLAENLDVRQSVQKAMAVLSRDGINKISIRRDKKSTLEIKKIDFPSFDIPDDGEEKIGDMVREMTVQIISLSFKEENKWRVTDGLEPFSVTIEDPDFLNKISKDEISFAKNDYLVCEVRERQFNTGKGLRLERAIVKVKSHRSSARQLKLL